MNRKIFYNGKISCMDKDSSCVEAVVTEGGIIKFVGKTSEAESFANPGSERIDLKGRRVIPGLIDTHSHFTRAALSEAKSIQFVPKSVKELLEYIKAKAKEREKGQWIYLPNIYPTRIEERRFPYLHELDEAAPDHPVYADGYYAGAGNTRALKITGLYESDRFGVIRDEQGKPTGRVLGLRNVFQKFIPEAQVTNEETDRAFSALSKEYLKCGITSVTEAMSFLGGVEGLGRAVEQGKPHIRAVLTFVMNPDHPEELGELKKATSGYREDFIKPLYGKRLIDGGILTGTSYMRKPYRGVKELFGYEFEDYHGNLSTDFDPLYRSLEICEENHMKFCVHATGNKSADLFLDVLEAYKAEYGRLSEGHALLHGNFTDSNTLKRIKELKAALLFQPAWFYKDSHAVVTFLDEEDFDTFLPYDVLYESGIHCAAGSDHMIKHDPNESINPFNPFIGIFNMVTRINEKGMCLGEHHRVDVDKAVRFYTEKAAYQGSGHEDKGKLVPGKKADFVCLSEDIFECPKEKILEIHSVMTVLDGEIRYEE